FKPLSQYESLAPIRPSLAECDSRIDWSPRSFWIGIRTDEPVEPTRPSFHPFSQNHGPRIVIFRDGFKPPVFLFRRLIETIPTGSFDLNYNNLEAIAAFERSPSPFVIFPNRKQIYYASRFLTSRSGKSDELPASHRLCLFGSKPFSIANETNVTLRHSRRPLSNQYRLLRWVSCEFVISFSVVAHSRKPSHPERVHTSRTSSRCSSV